MLRIKTFGGLVVLGDDRPLAGAAAQPRRLAILALLARVGERGLTRDKVLAYLWPDTEEERARRVLTQAIYALRRDLGSDDAIVGVKDLRLNPEVITSDVGDFETALARGRLREAAELYAGPFLDGFHLAGAPEFERWLETERGVLAHAGAELLEKLAGQAAQAGDHRRAVTCWRKLAAQDPLNAKVALGLMNALVEAGDRSGALQHARVYEALLEQELDAPPDRDVVLLARRIRQELDAASAEPLPPPSPAPTTIPPPPVVPPATVPAADTAVAALLVDTTGEPLPAISPAPGPWWRSTTGLLVGAVVVALLAAIAVLLAPPPVPPLLQPGRTLRVAFEPELEVDPAISPDGKVLAYAAGPQGNMRIYVRHLSGGRPIRVAEALGGNQRWPQWSPDGSRISFQGGHSVWLRPVDGGEAIKVADLFDPHSIAWAPDGKRLAVVSGNAGFVVGSATGTSSIGNIAPSAIWIVPLRGGKPVQVTDVANLNVSPVWTRDGKHIVFVSNRDGSRDLYAIPIGGDDRPAAPPERLTTGLDAHTISIAADGRRLVYSVFTYSSNIWSLPIPQGGPVSTGGAAPVTNGSQVVEGMGVSRDGRWLAFDSDRSGNQDIWRMPIGGGEPVQVTTTPWDDFMPQWGPGDREIAFYSFRDGLRRLYSIRSEGGQARALTRVAGDERHPSWSPDGRQIVLQAQRGAEYQLYLISRNADSSWSAPSQLTEDGGQSPRWSPDGRYISYLVYGDGHSLRVVPPSGGAPRELVRGDGSAARPLPVLADWAPDGHTLFYKAFDSTGVATIWAVSPGGGTPRLLVRFDDPQRGTNRPELANDGKRLYFTLGKPESDIWTMELGR